MTPWSSNCWSLHRSQDGSTTGPAGAGKSVVLAARASSLAAEDKHTLVVSYNITLLNYLRDLAVRHEASRAAIRRQIDFLNFHYWCKRVCVWIRDIAGVGEPAHNEPSCCSASDASVRWRDGPGGWSGATTWAGRALLCPPPLSGTHLLIAVVVVIVEGYEVSPPVLVPLLLTAAGLRSVDLPRLRS